MFGEGRKECDERGVEAVEAWGQLCVLGACEESGYCYGCGARLVLGVTPRVYVGMRVNGLT